MGWRSNMVAITKASILSLRQVIVLWYGVGHQHPIQD